MERQLLLLGLLRTGKMHGYQLNDFLERRWDFVTDLKPSTAYYLLDKLASEGYVRTHIEQVGHRPQRRVYEITPKGDTRFLELLRVSLAGRIPPIFGEEIGLSFLRELPSDEVHGYLMQKRHLLESDIARLSTLEATLPGEGKLAHPALDHHLTMLRAELAWLDSFLCAELAAQGAS